MIDKRYFIVKEKNDPSITYFEYDKMEGYDLSPKKNIKIKDAINVNKVVIINPSLMQKVASKKMDLKFKKLLQMMTVIFEEDADGEESGSAYREGLNEISKLRLEAKVKYQKFMEEEAFELLNKKLDILEQELKSRIYYLEQYYYQQQFVNQYQEPEEENTIGRRSR